MKIYKLFLISTILLSQFVSADVLKFYQVSESSEKICKEILFGGDDLISKKIKNNLVSIINVDPDKSFNVESTTKNENKLVITGKLFSEPEDPSQKLLGVTLHTSYKGVSGTLIKTEVNLKYNTPQLIGGVCNRDNAESEEAEASELWFALLSKK
ncbi:hypothetical protein [Zooshikella ganghwensis]|uniref:Uncharacterized protein n=1 Tax=Zooshikella ganghwensis TaxID=202772 RepID=A0A4P9VTX2_9GAMM|nr:hypothetical protein [Zooshikella ganghwensis]RDH46329.1 hypothetical protein B9G39_24355 [Zooshikella ganghwensis]